MIPKYILLDFDGTLFNLKIDWQEVKREIIGMSGDPGIFHRGFYNGISEINEPFLRERVYAYLTEMEIRGVDNGTAEMGYKDFLAKCLEGNIPTGIITRNSRYSVEKWMRNYHLSGIGTIIGREDVWSLKPSPLSMVLALQRLKASRDGTIYIGDDNLLDREFAKNSEVEFIHYTNWGNILSRLFK